MLLRFSPLFSEDGAPAGTAPPSAFAAPDWEIEMALIRINSLPANGGSPITALQYRVNAGTPVALSGVTTGDYDIPSLASGAEVQIRAVNAAGVGDWSDTKTFVATAPAITGVPTISGTTTEGQTLTATAASVTGTPTPTRTWQWRRSGTAISGATSATYTLVAADVVETVTVVQIETNAAGTASAESAATATIAPATSIQVIDNRIVVVSLAPLTPPLDAVLDGSGIAIVEAA